MTAAPPSAPAVDTAVPETEAGNFNLDLGVARAFLTFAGRFWTGPTAARAWALTIGLAASLVLSTYITVQMNHWNRWFFDALEKKDIATVKSAILVFFGIIACMAAIGVAIVLTRETLQVRWRAWLVEHLLKMWLDDSRYYHLQATGTEPPNPEYRISDDTRWATEILVDLGIGLLSAVVGGIAFITILWSVGGAITIAGTTIPGYMVWLALAYGILASTLMALIGRPLVGRVGSKNEAEGYFRFAMMRLRDNSESVALMRGGPAERNILGGFYNVVVARWLKIVRSHGHVTWITNASGPMIPIVPLLFAAPKYLAGDLTLGQVTQLAAAFVQVQIAISWVVDNYNRIAEWYASARRVMDVVTSSTEVHRLAPAPATVTMVNARSALELARISLADAEGRMLLAPVDLTVRRGEAVHITGASSSGKSTLARVLAGLTRPSGGAVRLPDGNRTMLVPQKPYLPLGTLADALAYPAPAAQYGPAALASALDSVKLGALAPRLGETQRWDQTLSVGERQRLAVARLLLDAPDVAVLDDALSALDDRAQADLLKKLRAALPRTAILSFAQRSPPAGIFDRALQITRADGDGPNVIVSGEGAHSSKSIEPVTVTT